MNAHGIHHHTDCASRRAMSAAMSASAHIARIMDTAMIAVSISVCVLSLLTSASVL